MAEKNVGKRISKQAMYSCGNTDEEKSKQKKEWKKRKHERRKKNATKNSSAEMPVEERNDLTRMDLKDQLNNPPCSVGEGINVEKNIILKDSAKVEQRKPSAFQQNARGVLVSDQRPLTGFSSGAVMLQMARGAKAVEKKPRKSTIPREYKACLKELDPDYLQLLSEHAVGSGSYRQCFHARYRGIEVIVKKMTHDDTLESKESAKKSLLREAEIVNALGDHTGLPMFFGVVTKKEPLCLVTQFHGVNGESITLHKAANKRMITPLDSIEIFIQICLALKHVHSKGYLHNDIKANNVLEKDLIQSSKFKPVLIDFGKGTKVAESSGSALSNRKRTTPAKTYLAPEVIKNRIYSIASDLYSLGRMLKAVAKVVGFYPKVRALVKEGTAELPSSRATLAFFMDELGKLKSDLERTGIQTPAELM
ncbi:uncharacterized protein [Montipora capricornis]|uniref:uncharacterized protein n=1 Tax=Montipora capricornis TaxID=246305 RepID=UPI0035F117D3